MCIYIYLCTRNIYLCTVYLYTCIYFHVLYIYLCLPGIFKLELSWRSVDGSLHRKLDWVQILADRSHVTLTISDSTLATSSRCLSSEDVEQGGTIQPAHLEQRNAYLHIDVFRIDQVIRNMITNAVCRWISPSIILFYDKIALVNDILYSIDEVHSRRRPGGD